jgi:translation initiation factor IF-1
MADAKEEVKKDAPKDEDSNHKPKEEGIEVEAVVREAVKGAFRVEIPSGKPGTPGHMVLAKPAGKLRLHNIKIVPGDRVKVEISPYDLSRGRITYRLK